MPIAFPGAEGFGAQSVGGRGGSVIEVTNLNDSGPGSFRAACITQTPRTIVFRVGGTCQLNTTVTIPANAPFCTIAAQTAPGGGFCLRNNPSLTQPPLIISAHDVIVRGLRIRPGTSTALASGLDGCRVNAQAYNVILDHCSLSWSTDETLSCTDGAHLVTVQWCIISEPLSNSTHDGGEHAKTFGINGKGAGSTKDISVHHNLLAHSNDRHPQNTSDGLVDIVNNVIYNWGDRCFTGQDTQAKVLTNLVMNYFKSGPQYTGKYEAIHNPSNTGFGFALYVNGNLGPHRPTTADPEENIVDPGSRQWIVATPHVAPAITTTSAAQAYNDVLSGAGAKYPDWDAVDKRIIFEVQNGVGKIIDDPSQVGGWPTLLPGTSPVDSDHDGMPDDWELANGLNPNDPGDRNSLAPSGYTWVEEYLNSLIATPTAKTPKAPTGVAASMS